MRIGFQELNRAAAYGAQGAGVLSEGALETCIPDSSSTGGDFMTTIPGRLLGGIAGVRPAGQNTAGQTQLPGAAGQQGFASFNGGDQYNIDNLHVHSNDADDMFNQLQQQQNRESSMAGMLYPPQGLGGNTR